MVTERPEGIVLGSLLRPLGLIQAIILYGLPRGFRCGLALIKRRLLLALRGVGLAFHELHHAGIIYPRSEGNINTLRALAPPSPRPRSQAITPPRRPPAGARHSKS